MSLVLVPYSNYLLLVSNPYRALLVDTLLFKGPQPCIENTSETTMTRGKASDGLMGCECPKSPSWISNENFDCAL